MTFTNTIRKMSIGEPAPKVMRAILLDLEEMDVSKKED